MYFEVSVKLFMYCSCEVRSTPKVLVLTYFYSSNLLLLNSNYLLLCI
jgi:hypothetical protein